MKDMGAHVPFICSWQGTTCSAPATPTSLLATGKRRTVTGLTR
jgi:hypothetical protein